MRSRTMNSTIEQGTDIGDEMLTTGEAARVLNSSRQHIVDLCNQGDLPFDTVGSHRRVRRRDVEAIRDRTLRMTRDQRRSYWLAFVVAGRIAENPERCLEIARSNLEVMRRSTTGRASVWLDEWERLLESPIDDLLSTMTSRSPRSRDLRQNSPFAGVPTDDERESALAAWRRQEAVTSRP